MVNNFESHELGKVYSVDTKRVTVVVENEDILNSIKINDITLLKGKNADEYLIFQDNVKILTTSETQIEIEDYTGASNLEVKGRLEALGLFVLIEKEEVEETEEEEYEDGEIIGQSIEAGEKVSAGTNITLYIPDVITYYPDFTNGEYTVDDVEDFADTYELDLKIEYEATNEQAPGTIIKQDRPTTQRVVAGQALKITIAEALEESSGEENPECENGLC